MRFYCNSPLGHHITSMLFLLSSLGVMLLQPQVSFGFPMGAGSCDAGSDALLQPNAAALALQIHGLLMQIGTGPLADYGLSMELDNVILDPNVATDFVYGMDHQLTLSASSDNSRFSGFLVRLGSTDGTRTMDSLLPVPGGDPLVKLADVCRSVNQVGGVTQTSASLKNQVNMTLAVESAATDLELDVTVVIETNGATNVSHWYYSRYILNAVDPPPSETTSTPAPAATSSDVGTPMPTTATPVDSTEDSPTPSLSDKDEAIDSESMGFAAQSIVCSFVAVSLVMTMSLVDML